MRFVICPVGYYVFTGRGDYLADGRVRVTRVEAITGLLPLLVWGARGSLVLEYSRCLGVDI